MGTKKIKSITVLGRRWFDRINGNTYCSAKILINGKPALVVPWEYGYGDHYLDLAGQALEKKLGIKKYPYSGTMPLWRYCEERKIAFHYEVADGLKRDLYTEKDAKAFE